MRNLLKKNLNETHNGTKQAVIKVKFWFTRGKNMEVDVGDEIKGKNGKELPFL